MSENVRNCLCAEKHFILPEFRGRSSNTSHGICGVHTKTFTHVHKCAFLCHVFLMLPFFALPLSERKKHTWSSRYGRSMRMFVCVFVRAQHTPTTNVSICNTLCFRMLFYAVTKTLTPHSRLHSLYLYSLYPLFWKCFTFMRQTNQIEVKAHGKRSV